MEQQSLPNNAPDRLNRPLPVRGLPVIPAEPELVAVSVKVLLRDVMKGAMYSALEQGEERLSSVNMHVTPDILALRVCDRLVTSGEGEADPVIPRRVVSHNLGITANALPNGPLERLSRETIYDTGMNAATWSALNQSHHRSLSFRTTSTLPQPRLAADVGFVYFDNSVQQGFHRLFAHSVSNTVGEMPGRLVGLEAEVSLELEGGNPLLMRAHRVECLNPLPERDMGPLHDRTDGDGELFPTPIALNQAVPDLRGFRRDPGRVLALAVRADRAFRPADAFEDRPGFILSQPGCIDGSHIFQVSKRRGNVAHV